MKALFRFLRGELLSGFYLKNIQAMMNVIDKPIRELFTYMHNVQMQWEGETALKSQDLYGIGKIAGVFLPAITTGEGYGSIRFGTSQMGTNGMEYEYIDGLSPLSVATDGAVTSVDIFGRVEDGFVFWREGILHLARYKNVQNASVYKNENGTFSYIGREIQDDLEIYVAENRIMRYDGQNLYLFGQRTSDLSYFTVFKFNFTTKRWVREEYTVPAIHYTEAIFVYLGDIYKIGTERTTSDIAFYKLDKGTNTFKLSHYQTLPVFNLDANEGSTYTVINEPIGTDIHILYRVSSSILLFRVKLGTNNLPTLIYYNRSILGLDCPLDGILNKIYIDRNHILWYKKTQSAYKGYIYAYYIHTGEVARKDAPKIYGAPEGSEYDYQYMMYDGKTVYYSNSLTNADPYVEYSAVKPTNTYGGVERSERGLFDRVRETFEYQRTNQDNYPTDINTLATSDLRSSFVGESDTVQGYIASKEKGVLDVFGNVKEEKVLALPPTTQAYSNFYGNQFMYLSEETNEIRTLDVDIFYAMYERLQYIRYNGISIYTLCNLIHILMLDGLVTIIELKQVPNKPVFELKYVFDPSKSDAPRKEQRLFVFKYIINAKYKQIKLVELSVNA